MLVIKEANIEEAVKVHNKVLEFDDNNITKDYFKNRYDGKNQVIIIAYLNNISIGYIIGYNKFNDGSYYCWMAGVDNNYRKQGSLTKMMNYLFNWSKNNNYKNIKIKTRNNRREMLNFLVKNDFNITGVEIRKKYLNLKTYLN